MNDRLSYLIQNKHLLSPEERERLKAVLRMKARGCRTNRYIDAVRPKLHPKQKLFLALNDLEVMFGGAAGGSKSDSLLIAAMQYVDVPGYSAILFRKTYTDLSGEGAIMDRAKKWLFGTDARWSDLEKSFFFPTRKQPLWRELHHPEPGAPSRLAFGYLDSDNDKYRYQGWEFHFVGFDELTQHPLGNYTYMFSRIRRTEGIYIPLRMRAATNPGGKYGEWVLERFIPEEYLQADEETQFSRIWAKRQTCEECGGTGTLSAAVSPSGDEEPCFYCDETGEQVRLFVPARVKDNPSLDQRQYLKSLKELSPVERYRLQHGRWDVSEQGGLFRASWFRYYDRRGEHFILHRPDAPNILVPQERVRYFLTADTASKEKTQHDYTVIMTWAYDVKTYDLMLVGAIREKMEVPKILPTIISASAAARADFVIIEDASSGIGVIQEARSQQGKGLTVKAYSPHDRDKVSRSTIAQIRMEAGQIYLPSGNPRWLQDVIAEWLAFPAGAHDDCVDPLSQAAWWVQSQHRVQSSSTKPGPVASGPLIPSPLGRRFETFS